MLRKAVVCLLAVTLAVGMVPGLAALELPSDDVTVASQTGDGTVPPEVCDRDDGNSR